MSEWKSDRLADLVTFQKGRKVDASPFPLTGYEKYLGAGALSGKSDGYASTFFAVLAAEQDVLMLWDGERSGLCGTGLSGVVSSTVSKLSANGKIDSNLLYYLLLQNFEWIQHRRTGTGVPHVPKDIGKILCIRYPERKAEQKKVAHILQTIDQAIEKTQALIEKYQQIKAGLMQDLFTRGIAPNGQLRPPREQAPELYQQTPIGWIPRDWSIENIQELAYPGKGSTVIGPFGSDLVMSDYRSEGVPVVFVRDIKEDGFRWVSDTYVSNKKAQKLSSHKVNGSDIVITKMGLPPCVAAVYPHYLPTGIITADIIRMTVDNNKVNPYWLCTALNYDRVKRQVAAITAGVTRQKVTLFDFRTLRISLPPMSEQLLIKQSLDAHADLIRVESSRLENLEKQKAGLMHDLLTGEVPVHVEFEEERAVETA